MFDSKLDMIFFCDLTMLIDSSDGKKFSELEITLKKKKSWMLIHGTLVVQWGSVNNPISWGGGGGENPPSQTSNVYFF